MFFKAVPSNFSVNSVDDLSSRKRIVYEHFKIKQTYNIFKYPIIIVIIVISRVVVVVVTVVVVVVVVVVVAAVVVAVVASSSSNSSKFYS